MSFENIVWSEIWQATQDTLMMMLFSIVFTIILGLAIGVLLYLTSSPQLLYMPVSIPCFRLPSTFCALCPSSF